MHIIIIVVINSKTAGQTCRIANNKPRNHADRPRRTQHTSPPHAYIFRAVINWQKDTCVDRSRTDLHGIAKEARSVSRKARSSPSKSPCQDMERPILKPVRATLCVKLQQIDYQ